MEQIEIVKLETSQIQVNSKIANAANAYEVLSYLKEVEQEHFLVICLDGANQIKKIYTATVGLLNRCQVHAREVFYYAIAERSAAIIIAHNHPSGECSPSTEDDKVTKDIVKAGEFLEIRVLDHLIVCKEGYYSYQEHGKI